LHDLRWGCAGQSSPSPPDERAVPGRPDRGSAPRLAASSPAAVTHPGRICIPPTGCNPQCHSRAGLRSTPGRCSPRYAAFPVFGAISSEMARSPFDSGPASRSSAVRATGSVLNKPISKSSLRTTQWSSCKAWRCQALTAPAYLVEALIYPGKFGIWSYIDMSERPRSSQQVCILEPPHSRLIRAILVFVFASFGFRVYIL
jgi:hypothetical protein